MKKINPVKIHLATLKPRSLIDTANLVVTSSIIISLDRDLVVCIPEMHCRVWPWQPYVIDPSTFQDPVLCANVKKSSFNSPLLLGSFQETFYYGYIEMTLVIYAKYLQSRQ
jgi:hypothetical protein